MVVAEGAGQDYLAAGGTDASGNRRLGDFGLYLRQRILDDFAAAGEETNLKYIDPSYLIRSVPANPYDSVYCLRLAQAAVHAAMAGRTEMVVGSWRGRFVHVPIPLAVSSPQPGRPVRRPVDLGPGGHRPARLVQPRSAGPAGRESTASDIDAGGHGS